MRRVKVLLAAELVLEPGDRSPWDALDRVRETLVPSDYGLTLFRPRPEDFAELIAAREVPVTE